MSVACGVRRSQCSNCLWPSAKILEVKGLAASGSRLSAGDCLKWTEDIFISRGKPDEYLLHI